jgi:hypothetical protein
MSHTPALPADHSPADHSPGGHSPGGHSPADQSPSDGAVGHDADTNESCSACTHAQEHGWWGPIAPARSHCRKCHRGWASLKEGHCPRCCTHFATPAAFDAHLTTDSCADPSAVTRRDGRPRLICRQRSFGPVWALAYYGERPSHWGGGNTDIDTDLDAGDVDLDMV